MIDRTSAARDARGLSFLLDLADGRVGLDTAEAAHHLAVALERLRPMSATAVACDWALSPRPADRLTLARALAWTFRLLGDRTILAHLALDGDPRVRSAVAEAIAARRLEPR